MSVYAHILLRGQDCEGEARSALPDPRGTPNVRRLPTPDGHDHVHGVSQQNLPPLLDAGVLGERGIVPLLPPPALPQVWQKRRGKGVICPMVGALALYTYE